MNAVKLAVVNGNTISQALALRASKQGAAARVRAFTGSKFILADDQTGYAPQQVTVRQVGEDLQVSLEDTDDHQPQLIIEDFYKNESTLVGLGEDGAYHAYIAPDNALGYASTSASTSLAEGVAVPQSEGVAVPQVLGAAQMTGFGAGLVAAPGISWLGLGLFGLGALGVVGSAAASGLVSNSDDGSHGGGSDNDDNGGSGNDKPGNGSDDSNHGGGSDNHGGGRDHPPRQPTLERGSVQDNVGSIQGPIDPSGVTDDRMPTFSGTDQTPGNRIEIWDRVNNQKIGQTVVLEDGNWTFKPTTPLSEGAHTVFAIEVDADGNASPPSSNFDFSVDTTAPDKAVIGTVHDAAGNALDNSASTRETAPTFSGHAEAGTHVKILDNGKQIGEVIVNESGAWTFTPPSPLDNGTHVFKFVVTDPAGNVGLPSDPWTVIVDTEMPAQATIDTVYDNVGSITGHLSNGATTDDTMPTLSGHAEAGTRLEIFDGQKLIGKITSVQQSGSWTFTPTTPLSEGPHVFTVVATDAAGNVGVPSDPWTVIVDTTAPDRPIIDVVYDDVGSVMGPLTNGAMTDDTTPTLSGRAEARAQLQIFDGKDLIGETVARQNGSWTFTPTTALRDGPHAFTVIATNPITGSVSPPSAEWTVIVDTVPPVAHAFVTDMGKNSGLSPTDLLTNDGSAGRLISGTLSAALAAGDKVQVSTDGGHTWHNAQMRSDNIHWLFQDHNAHHTSWDIQTRVIDLVGHVNTESRHVTLETSTPTAPTNIERTGNTVTVSFDANKHAVGDKVNLMIGKYHADHLLTQDDLNAGKISITLPANVSQNAQAKAALVDSAGNVSSYVIGKQIVTEDFSSVTDYKHYYLGETLQLDTMSVTIVGKIGKIGTGYIGVNNHNLYGKTFIVGEGAIAEIIPPFPCSEISFDSLYLTPNVLYSMKYEFYDPNGIHLHTVDLPLQRVNHTVSYTADPGILIGKIVASNTRTNQTAGGFLDNFRFETTDIQHVPLPHTQYVTAQTEALYGSDQDDIFKVADVNDLNHVTIAGNGGIDTLQLTGADQTLDLSKLLQGKLSSIEVIDLGKGHSPGHHNTLNLSLGDVLEQGGQGLFIRDDKTQMKVFGDAGDTVNLSNLLSDGSHDLGHWAQAGTVTEGGTMYDVFVYSGFNAGFNAEVLVQHGVDTHLVYV